MRVEGGGEAQQKTKSLLLVFAVSHRQHHEHFCRYSSCQLRVWSITILTYMDFNLMTLPASKQSIKCGGIKREEKIPIIIYFSSDPLRVLVLLDLAFLHSGMQTIRLHFTEWFWSVLFFRVVSSVSADCWSVSVVWFMIPLSKNVNLRHVHSRRIDSCSREILQLTSGRLVWTWGLEFSF